MSAWTKVDSRPTVQLVSYGVEMGQIPFSLLEEEEKKYEGKGIIS